MRTNNTLLSERGISVEIVNMNQIRKKNPVQLNSEEEALERSFGTDEWIDSKDDVERSNAILAAKLTKSERTNVRLAPEDLEGIKLKAQEKGLGYQTLIASLVHQYVKGSLVELDTAVTELAMRMAKKLSGAQHKTSRSARPKPQRREIPVLTKTFKKHRKREAQG
ncbi:MAG: hypothetical protein HY074_12810 [Deltaproteobacteria bacterium]|nr:hypothetical protein [Deltaproteobacteria bacterium]